MWWRWFAWWRLVTDDDCYDGGADDDCYEGDADDDCYDGYADDGDDSHRKALSFHGYQWH